jgi:hypothetical protein
MRRAMISVFLALAVSTMARRRSGLPDDIEAQVLLLLSASGN